jgi:hypothetical protein
MDALNRGKLLSPRSLQLMYSPMHTREGKISGFPNTAGYGMGWNVMHTKAGDV